ncbi:MAG: nitroreductase family protein [Candidatus Cloacimonetes bacterium]|nr:nitroreductase family protein [Candidatus Cloacimonadota bacterium]
MDDFTNPVIELLVKHRSIRKFKEKDIPQAMINTIVRSGQQAAFAFQAYSVLLSKNKKKNPFHAPLYFIPCLDLHKIEKIMETRKWKIVLNDLYCLLLGLQDAAYMAQNMVIAAESLGLGTCYIGAVPYYADKIAEQFDLPKKVFPLVGIAIGYPAEDPPTRPRYPLSFSLFEDNYPELDESAIENAKKVMDEGYLSQDYYKQLNAKISLTGGRKETFDYDTYSWTEHISRKLGQWDPSPDKLLEQFRKRGFDFSSSDKK